MYLHITHSTMHTHYSIQCLGDHITTNDVVDST